MAKENTKRIVEGVAGKANGLERSWREDYSNALPFGKIMAARGEGCEGFCWMGALYRLEVRGESLTNNGKKTPRRSGTWRCQTNEEKAYSMITWGIHHLN